MTRTARPRPVKGRVAYIGNSYYNNWYLAQALKAYGWQTLVSAIPEGADPYLHGYDTYLDVGDPAQTLRRAAFLLKVILKYDIIHFTNMWNLRFLYLLAPRLHARIPYGSDIRWLKRLGKKIVYSHTGCLDGVSQSSFRKWGPEPVCDICPWQHVPSVCSDEGNLRWGKIRNELADYQILLGGNRVDYNLAPQIHEVPEFYCLDSQVWHPELLIPSNFRLPIPKSTVKIYHAVGNYQLRSDAVSKRNIKSTHIYVPLVDRLKAEGYDVELLFFTDVPNKSVRFYQAQADIVVDMLTFGFFGANVREAMMLGKPVVCFIRPEWRESMRAEIPDYEAELPVVSATPETVYDVLKDLIEHPEKRREIGRRSREFAVKWHSAEAAGRRFDEIYSGLLGRQGRSRTQ